MEEDMESVAFKVDLFTAGGSTDGGACWTAPSIYEAQMWAGSKHYKEKLLDAMVGGGGII